MKNVLIVDDSPTFQRLLGRLLGSTFQIKGQAGSGIEGFELYKKLRPDLVFLDITMPNCNGKECLQLIINFDPNAHVIMVSSLDDETTVTECLKLGAKAFVRKDELSAKGAGGALLLQTAQKVIGSHSEAEAA